MAILSQNGCKLDNGTRCPEQDIMVSRVTRYMSHRWLLWRRTGAAVNIVILPLSSVAIRRLPRHSRPLLFILTVHTILIPISTHSLGFPPSLFAQLSAA